MMQGLQSKAIASKAQKRLVATVRIKEQNLEVTLSSNDYAKTYTILAGCDRTNRRLSDRCRDL